MLVAVPSTEVLAWAELAAGESGLTLADARRNELYVARYCRTADEIVALVGPETAPPDAIARRLAPGEAVLCEDEVARESALAAGAEPDRIRVRVPRASALLDLALRRLARDGPTDPAHVEPLYLRPFAAPRPSH